MTPREMKMQAFLSDCEDVYVTGGQGEDLSSWNNVVVVYQNAVGQKKYVHMYFAKTVACWRTIRQKLATQNDGPVYSVGAGPCTCLMGWFYDNQASDNQPVVGVDVLDWMHIRGLTSFRELLGDILGPGAVRSYWSDLYIPDTCPPQVAQLTNGSAMRGFPPQQIPEGATILIPYVLNHLLGQHLPIADRTKVFGWLESVRARARRVILVDMQSDRAGEFWDEIRRGLGITGSATIFYSSGINDFSQVYSDKGNWPKRRTSRYMMADTVLHGDKSGWRFL